MTNKEHVEILKKGVKAWHEWRKQNSETKPDLIEADLREADLIRADLSGADLREANLYLADLSDANLRGANLRGAHFEAAILDRADLTDSNMAYTVVADLDLSVAKGLEAIKHEHPSTVGIDTIYQTKGNDPDAFLS